MVLRWTQLGDERVVTCQNCGFLADKARPRVTTREALVERFERSGGSERVDGAAQAGQGSQGRRGRQDPEMIRKRIG